MRRRLLDLCVLAYPRVRRGPDREYMRDLALELGEACGLWRQAVSLVRGGIGERITSHRMRRGTSPSVSMRGVAIGCFLVAGVAFAASSLMAIVPGDVERAEADRFACVDIRHSRSQRYRHVDAASECAQTAERLVAARLREGWDCAVRRRARDGHREIAWRCTV